MALNTVSSDRLSTNVKASNLNAGFGQIGDRSVIINGEFQIAQRSTSTASITGAGYHTCDRWYTTLATAGTWTQSQDTDVPAGTAFKTSLKMDCTTADGSLAAGDRLMLSYRLEGQDVQRFGKGTTSPKKFALSFWVKSPKTGTHIVELFDHDNSRHICKAYTIASADTWEQQKLIFDNETSNAFGNDNGKSLEIQFYLAAGSQFSSGTLDTSWAANNNANRAVGQVNVADNTANNFYLCGVKLETGEVCTDFEHRSFGEELALCQRYCCKWDAAGATTNNHSRFGTAYNQNSSSAMMFLYHPVPMRVTDGRTITHNIGAVEILTPGNSTSSLTLSGDGSSNMITAVSLNSIGSVTQHALCAPRVGSGQTDWYIIIACEL